MHKVSRNFRRLINIYMLIRVEIGPFGFTYIRVRKHPSAVILNMEKMGTYA